MMFCCEFCYNYLYASEKGICGSAIYIYVGFGGGAWPLRSQGVFLTDDCGRSTLQCRGAYAGLLQSSKWTRGYSREWC